jgi:hypothetical protein
MQITFVLILRSALFARVSKDGNKGARGHPRDAAEFIIGPRFARTRWPLLRMRAEHDAEASISSWPGFVPAIHVFLGR